MFNCVSISIKDKFTFYLKKELFPGIQRGKQSTVMVVPQLPGTLLKQGPFPAGTPEVPLPGSFGLSGAER